MARKFQIGDTVQVVKDLVGDSLTPAFFNLGHRGVVVAYKIENMDEPYEVMRKNKNRLWFGARELKLIKRKVKKQKN